MTSPIESAGSWGSPAQGEVMRYLSDTAPGHGGRNARPLALPALVATYCSGSRTAQGASAALLGVAAGGAAWFGLAQLAEPEPSTVLSVVSLVVAAGALAAGVAQGVRVVRSGASLVGAMRRWHAVAPEVPVRGTDVLTSGAGLARLVLAVTALVAGLVALAVAVATGTMATWLGLGLAALWLIGSGAVAASGWSRVRALLRTSAPQTDQAAFAPAYAPAPSAPSAPPPPSSPQQWAPPPNAPAPGEPWPVEPRAVESRAGGVPPWMPQSAGQPVQPQPAPWLPPPSAIPATTTWNPTPEGDVGDTRFAGPAEPAADTTMSGRTKVAVVLDDGRRLEVGTVTLVGRDPQPRTDEPDAARLSVQHPTVSKTHAAFRVARDSVHVTDRASTNGTTVIDPEGGRRRLEPWVEERVGVGDEVLLGSYRVRVTAAD